MTSLAAIAHAGIKRHIIAQGADLFEGGGAVTDEGGTGDRLTDLAISNAVGLGAGKHEFAICDVDLTATESDGINSVFQVRDQCFGGSIASSFKNWKCVSRE